MKSQGANLISTLKFDNSAGNWKGVWMGTYAKDSTSSVNGDIEVNNTYTAQEITIDLQKYGTDYNQERDGSVFELYKGEMSNGALTWPSVPMNDSIKPLKETIGELKLQPGYYKLVEVEAPAGYTLLENPIYFQVLKERVVLIEENGTPVEENKKDMWEIVIENKNIVLKVQNKALYDLPSAGGPGIHLYMLGGTLLMMAGALLVYKKRKEEVLRS